MITAILTAAALFILTYGYFPLLGQFIICGLSLLFFHRHGQENRLTIDVIAQTSPLNTWNPMEKCLFVLICMILCLCADTPITGLILAAVMGIASVFLGKIKHRTYLHLLSVPVAFLMLSILVLLFENMNHPSGIIQIPFFHGYLCVTKTAQVHAALVLTKAIGAVSCLYFLSLSTPMHEIIGVLNRLPVPKIITELMYLIYRCIFILLSMYDSMKAAADSRLGFLGYKNSVKTTGYIYGNLLAKSYRKAMQMFDAMESRCYEGNISFLSAPHSFGIKQAAIELTVIALSVLSFLL